jgi:hypothetical protein
MGRRTRSERREEGTQAGWVLLKRAIAAAHDAVEDLGRVRKQVEGNGVGRAAGFGVGRVGGAETRKLERVVRAIPPEPGQASGAGIRSRNAHAETELVAEALGGRVLEVLPEAVHASVHRIKRRSRSHSEMKAPLAVAARGES